jgi:hypothetical protein
VHCGRALISVVGKAEQLRLLMGSQKRASVSHRASPAASGLHTDRAISSFSRMLSIQRASLSALLGGLVAGRHN